jgi:tail-anchored protein insertion receptor
VPTSKTAAQQRKLQEEFVKVRRDMNATSSQDEFAKWAKLRRTQDKLQEQLEKNSMCPYIRDRTFCSFAEHAAMAEQMLDASRAQFDTYLTGARWLLTRVPQYTLPFWYGKEPMFWLPHGWFPYYAEWLLSFPRAPMGSVSIASWQVACTVVIGIVSQMVTSAKGLAVGSKTEGPAMKVPSSGGKIKKEKQAASEEKKEL